MALDNEIEFDGILTLIQNIQETVEERFQEIVAAEQTSLDKSEPLAKITTLLKEYEVDDAVILATLKENFCDLQPTDSFFTPWRWTDLRDGEAAVEVLNQKFTPWLGRFDSHLLSQALVDLRNLGHHLRTYKAKLEPNRSNIFSFLRLLGLTNAEVQAEQLMHKKNEEEEIPQV